MTKVSKKEIQVIEKQVSPLLVQAGQYIIKSSEDVDESSEFLKKLRDTERQIEFKRLEFTKPLNQSLRTINATFKQLKQPLIDARGVLTQKILVWRTAEMERLAKEEERRRKIQEAHAKKGHEVKAPIVLERPQNKIGSTQVSKVWKWKLVDFRKLHDDYKMCADTHINMKIREGVRKIKGLEIYQEERLSVVNR